MKSALEAYHDERQATSKFALAAVILSDPVLDTMRRELRRMSPDVRIDVEAIRAALTADVLKRDVLEGEQADQARRRLTRTQNRLLRIRKEEQEQAEAEPAVPAPQAKPTPNAG